jgi:hypothetical protein
MLTDAEVTALLRSKNYRLLLKFLKSNCRETFRTEQSGETFEKWVNWCARNSRNVADAKEILRLIFAEFYVKLPMIARVNLSHIAYEIGYDHSKFNFAKFKYLSREVLASGGTFLASIAMRVWDYAASRQKPTLQVSYFRQARRRQPTYGAFADARLKRMTR